MDEFVDVNLKPLFEGIVNTFLKSEELHRLLQKRVDEAFQRFRPDVMQIVTVDRTAVKENARREVADVVQAFHAGLRNIMLVGPAGCGKSTLARDAFDAMGYDPESIVHLSCNPEMGQAAYLGRSWPDPNGVGMRFIAGPVADAAEQGKALLLDELDNGDASAQLVLNPLLDRTGILPVPHRADNPKIRVHPNFRCITTANTYGRGSDRMYVGRNQMDEAFLDRFAGGIFYIDYDNRLEGRIARGYSNTGKMVLGFMRDLRKEVYKHKIRRVVSTRMLEAMCVWAEIYYAKKEEPVLAVDRILVGWNEDEMAKMEIKSLKDKHFRPCFSGASEPSENESEEEST